MAPELIRLQRETNLQQAWFNEPAGFTPWLRDNIDLLGQAIGLDLELAESEVAVGDFSADIVAKEVGSSRKVVIENQLQRTDHDHLGKLLTYCAGVQAEIVVWVSGGFRAEHSAALNWLNQNTLKEAAFFGIEIELYRIDETKLAPQLKVVARPDEFVKASTGASKEITPRQLAYHEFFEGLLDVVKARYPGITNARSVAYESFFGFPVGRTGFTLYVSFAQGGRLRVELYIDTLDKDRNEDVLSRLEVQKAQIESQVGLDLSWEKLENARACRIAAYQIGSITSPSETLVSLRDWSADTLAKFRQVFAPLVATA